MLSSPTLPTPPRDLRPEALPDTQPVDDNDDVAPPVLRKFIIISKDGLPFGDVKIIDPYTGRVQHGKLGSSRRFTYP